MAKPKPRKSRKESSAPAMSGAVPPGANSIGGLTAFAEWAGANRARAFGPPVNERIAMTLPAVYACVRIRSGLVAQMPPKVYRRLPNGTREEATDHRMWPALNVTPNATCPITSFQWVEMVMQNVDLYGNAFARIIYDRAGRAMGFEPWLPWDVTVYRDHSSGENIYHHTPQHGETRVYFQDEVLHLFGPSNDGIVGASKIRYHARDAVALSMVLAEQTGRVHENAAHPSGAIKLAPGIKAEGLKLIREQFSALYSGRENAGRVMFLDSGTEFTRFQISPLDLATIQQREMQVADIANFFGVPGHLLNQKGITGWGTGIVEMNLAMLQHTINPELRRIEAEINRKVFGGSEYFCEFDRSVLLQMSPQAMAETTRVETSIGVMTINEARRLRNRPPVPGGDEPLVNAASVPLSRVIAEPAPPPSPAPVAPFAAEEPGAPNEPNELDDDGEDDAPQETNDAA